MVNQRRVPADQLKDQRASRTRGAPTAPEPSPLPELVPVDIPTPPAKLSPRSRARWDLYWTSPLREYALNVDRVTIVERYFEMLDIHDAALARFKRQPYVRGSMKQLRVGPSWQIVRETTYILQSLEEQLGIGPRSRLRLNITFGENVETFGQWFAALSGSFATPGGEHEDAPRGTVVEFDSEGNIVGL